MTFAEMLARVKEKGASDLHITTEAPALIRVDGELAKLDGEVLGSQDTQKLIYSILTEEQKKKFEENQELDTAFSLKGVGRFRLNVFRQKNALGAVCRLIPETFKTFEQLGLPLIAYQISKLPKGLVLITGPTGSGKTTTLASIINHINEERSEHILTIEDPIEFVHPNKKCIVNQREVGSDTQSFANALRHVLRQDPDVILIGEMRDLETIQAALNIAETGHLVFATLHTNDSAQSINRVIDVFPAHQQEQVRVQLSFVLEAIMSQQLLSHISNAGRVLVGEVLMVTPAIRNLIREAKIEQIPTLIQTGSKFGMQTMNQSLADLYKRRLISYQTALESTSTPEDLKKLIATEPRTASRS